MPQVRYDLVILHHTSSQSVENLVQDLLKLLGKTGDSYLEYKLSEALLFEKSSSAILDNIDEEQGKHYQEAFRRLQVETELRPTLQLVAKDEASHQQNTSLFNCPACGHQQNKRNNDMNTCEQCGVVGEKFEKLQKRKTVYESEKRKLEQTQKRQLQEAMERSFHEEQESLRQEARQKLGVTKNKRVTHVLTGLAAIGAMGIGAYLITAPLFEANEGSTITATEKATPLLTTQDNNDSNATDPSYKELLAGDNGPEGSENTVTTAVKAIDKTGQATVDSDTDSRTDEANIINPTENMQLTMLTPQNKRGDQDGLPIKNSETPRQELSRDILSRQPTINELTSNDELKLLRTLLDKESVEINLLGATINNEAFAGQQKQLQHLLKLDKTELALVFAETIENPYVASLLILDITRHENEQQRNNHHDSIQNSLKTLMTRHNQTEGDDYKALLASGLARFLRMTEQSETAALSLEEALTSLKASELPLHEQVLQLAQMETDHRQDGNEAGAKRIAKELLTHIRQLPASEHLALTRAFTQLASRAFSDNSPDIARDWLTLVPAADARAVLLDQLTRMESLNISKRQ